MKALILGYKEHGKGTTSKFIKKHHGLTSISSSWAAAPEIFKLIGKSFGYKSVKQCWEDRVNHRELWFILIKGFNVPDPTWLSSKIYEQSDIYDGMRSHHELKATLEKGLIDVIIWVEDPRKEKEADSMDIALFPTMNLAKINGVGFKQIFNDQGFDELEEKVKALDFSDIKKPH